MQYLITGATGFIGSNLVRELLKDPEALVIALVRKNANLWRLQGIEKNLILLTVDFLDYETLLKCLGQFTPKICFHLAWEGVQNPYRNDLIQMKNVSILKNLLKLTKDLKIEMFVGLGSQAEYGIKNHPIKEEENLNPITLYGIEKVKAYEFMKSYCKTYDIKYSWLRLFSSYGPMDNPFWLIPYVIKNLLEDKVPLLTEGIQEWDYLYVEDVVKAIAMAAFIDESGVFNLGSGATISIRKAVGIIYDQLKPELRPVFGTLPMRKNQQMHLQSDITKLLSKSLWRPSISLVEGLSKTIRYYREDLLIH